MALQLGSFWPRFRGAHCTIGLKSYIDALVQADTAFRGARAISWSRSSVRISAPIAGTPFALRLRGAELSPRIEVLSSGYCWGQRASSRGETGRGRGRFVCLLRTALELSDFSRACLTSISYWHRRHRSNPCGRRPARPIRGAPNRVDGALWERARSPAAAPPPIFSLAEAASSTAARLPGTSLTRPLNPPHAAHMPPPHTTGHATGRPSRATRCRPLCASRP